MIIWFKYIGGKVVKGSYVDFVYFPINNEYKAVVQLPNTLGTTLVKLENIINIQEFSQFINRAEMS